MDNFDYRAHSCSLNSSLDEINERIWLQEFAQMRRKYSFENLILY